MHSDSTDSTNIRVDEMQEYVNPNGRPTTDECGPMFIPNNLPPPPITYSKETERLLAEAKHGIAQLKHKRSSLSNPNSLLKSCLESQIENGFIIEIRNCCKAKKWKETGLDYRGLEKAAGYIAALEWAIQKIRDKDQCIDWTIIRQTHYRLMNSRLTQENGSEFRVDRISLKDESPLPCRTVYIPPSPKKFPELLHNLEEFIQKTHADIPILVQCAMIHYQFVAIHPFGNGNGRMGRLIVPLVLSKTGLLCDPLFDLGPYFEMHKAEYDGLLLQVSQKSQWDKWIRFFLQAIIVQSRKTLECIQERADQ